MMSAADASTAFVLNVEAVLFDMDGTLVDSTAVVEHLWQEFADLYDLSLSEVLAYSHGRQTGDTVRRFLPAGNEIDQVTADLQARELTRTEGITEIAGAQRLLQGLRSARTAIVTSAPRSLAISRLVAAGLGIPEVLIAGDDVSVGKPDPSGYQEAARLLGVVPARCLVVEDAEAGIQAGVAAGAQVLVVGDRIRASQVHHRVPDLREVTAVVGSDGFEIQVGYRFDACIRDSMSS
jgi:sugar-phosphatase